MVECTYNIQHIPTNIINNISHLWKSIIKNYDIYKLGINNMVHSGNNTYF